MLSGGIYNPRKATCGGTCETCPGMTSTELFPDDFAVATGAQSQGSFSYTWYTGTKYDITASSSWSSSASQILSVQTRGQTSPGLSQGVSPGSADISVLYLEQVPVNQGQICIPSGELPPCPVAPELSGEQEGCDINVTVNSANLVANQISTTASAPSGVTSGTFSLWESNGSGTNYSVNSASRTPGSYTDGFNLNTSMPTGQYTTINASWTACGASMTTPYNYQFYNYGNTHQSQYTLISESTCSGAQTTAYIITNLSACFSSGLQTTTLESDFLSQTEMNGTGMEKSGTYVKALTATSCANATKGKPAGASNANTLVVVSTVTGACNQALSSSTVAQYQHQCGTNIFISGYGSPGTEKTVEDECTRCGNDPPHFDNWTTAGGSACGLNVTDLQPGGHFVTEKVQQ